MVEAGHELLGSLYREDAATPPSPTTQRVLTRAAVACLILGLMSFTGAAALYWDGRDPAHLSLERAREVLAGDASVERRSNAAFRIQKLGLRGIAALKKSAIAGDETAYTMLENINKAATAAVQAMDNGKSKSK